MSKIEEIHKDRKHDLTLKEVKSVSMFSHFTDEEAKGVVESFKQLSLIVFEFYQNQMEEITENN